MSNVCVYGVGGYCKDYGSGLLKAVFLRNLYTYVVTASSFGLESIQIITWNLFNVSKITENFKTVMNM